MTDFKFKVEREVDWNDPEYVAACGAFRTQHGMFGSAAHPDYPQPPKKERWIVSLPHQCDSWEIAGEYGYGAEHDTAVAELEEFIMQARAALVALRVKQEMGL